MSPTRRVRCKRCASLMVFVQRRGSSEGLWLCPVCAASRRIVLGEQGDFEERADPDRLLTRNVSSSGAKQPVGGQTDDSVSADARSRIAVSRS